MQDIYLPQKEFAIAKHNLLSFQIVGITLNGIICFKKIYLFGTKWRFLQCNSSVSGACNQFSGH